MNDDVLKTTPCTAAGVRTRATPTPRRGHLPFGEPDGRHDAIQVTSRWIERAGRPWFPITGEIHYSRLPRERWSEVLGLAKAGGLNSVATYVFWQAHEPTPGDFRWTGNLDLRAFVQLAGQHGLDVIVRMGPWAHGEARHGGFPDWVVESGIRTRTNDPAYLELVRRLSGQIVSQLSGLTHADGGPVIGAQMDNELYDQPQHLAMLRSIAEDLGLRVPIWTATGWGGAQVPDTLLPLYSAYPDGFWEETTTEWPAFAAFHFRYSEVRDDLTVGADVRQALDGVAVDPNGVSLKNDEALPFATCELGGGMHVAYHRRPLVTADDVTALALAKIGSGSIWQGYYMYSGGTQRVGASGPEQESHATGYPNDVPTRTYDFYAPIGEYGQIRPHYHRLRRQHLWLQLDGSAIAAMNTAVGGGSDDPDELRWSVRSDGHRGYVFVTTYQPARCPLPPQPDVQLSVGFDDTVVQVPSRPVDLPAGVSVVWPLRFPLTDAVTLRSATAEIITIVQDDGPLLVLAATDGIPVELVLDGDVPASGPVSATAEDGATVLRLDTTPGPEAIVELPGARILVLDEATADKLYRLEFGGRERLVLSDVPIYVLDGDLVAHNDGPTSSVAFLPAAESLGADGGTATPVARNSAWSWWGIETPGAGAQVVVSELRPVAPAPPAVTTGGPLDRLSAPTDFSGAAKVHLDLPADALGDADRVLLRSVWTGDVGRLLVDDCIVSDHFWHGRVWDVDLTPWREVVGTRGVSLELLPWRPETGVWVDPSVRDVAEGITVSQIQIIRIERVVLSARERMEIDA